MPKTNNQKASSILGGVRDNLLKPMTEEICSRNLDSIKKIRVYFIAITILLAANLFLSLIILTFLLFFR